MNAAPRNRKLFLWPAAAILIGALASVNPFHASDISLRLGIVAWYGDMALALVCWVHPIIARAGLLLTGAFMAVPCFLDAPPLIRACLMCGMMVPLVIASVPVLASSVTGLRGHLALLSSWDRTRELKRSPRYFDGGSLLRLFLATIVFAMALDAVKTVPPSGFWYLARWLAGGVMILAFAEMLTACQNFLAALLGFTAPLLMCSPFLSRSVTEFWNRRWNPGTSFMFRRICFEPLAKSSPVLALFAVFVFSGAIHTLLFYVATVRWNISLVNGSFFFVQPLFIVAERKLNVRRWPASTGRAWTLVVLAFTSPLFVEPGLQLIESTLGFVLFGALFGLGLVLLMQGLFSVAALIACSGTQNEAILRRRMRMRMVPPRPKSN